MPLNESSKQQDVARTWDALHAGSHAPTLSELDTFKVDRALPSIIDWSTTQDTVWAHTVLLATLLGKNHPVVSALIIFLKRISKLRTNLIRETTRQSMLGKYFYNGSILFWTMFGQTFGTTKQY